MSLSAILALIPHNIRLACEICCDIFLGILLGLSVSYVFSDTYQDACENSPDALEVTKGKVSDTIPVIIEYW